MKAGCLNRFPTDQSLRYIDISERMNYSGFQQGWWTVSLRDYLPYGAIYGLYFTYSWCHLTVSTALIACKKDSHLCKSFPFISSFLSSRAASGQVLSAFVSLTSVFGMDTGDPHSCRHCFSESLFSQNHIEEVLKLFACLGVPKLRPRPISFMSLQALRLFHS